MNPMKKYPFLSPWLSPFEKRHQETLALVIAAIATTAQARSFAIATTMARWLGTRLDSAVNRFYRLLRNARVDYIELAVRLARQMVKGPRRHLLIAIDWTEWHHGLRLLCSAVVTGKRAIPLLVQAFKQIIRQRSQNARENTFLRVLAEILHRAECTATILCDRGFRRVSWLKLLQQLRLGFVVRLMDDVLVELAPSEQVALSTIPLLRGQVLDLGFVPIRSDGAISARVIGYFAPWAKEPWWLATSDSGPASFTLKLYDRRMTVEEQFRDTKGRRFGAELFWTHFRDPEALARFVMLLAVALLIWLLTGLVAAMHNPSLRLTCRRKGPRQSYITIGLRLLSLELQPLLLTQRRVTSLLEPPAFRKIVGTSRGGK